MTTTMSFFNRPGTAGEKGAFWHLYQAGLKRCLGLGCLYAVFLQLTYTLPVLFKVQNYQQTWMEEPLTTALAFLQSYGVAPIAMTSVLVCVCAVLFSTVSYSYMHNRRGADFYHSLPVGRGTLLLAHFASVFTTLALPLLASGLVCLLFFPAFSVAVPAAAMAQVYFSLHGLWLLIALVLMSLTAFVAVNAATVIETAGYTCAFSVMGSLLYFIWVLLCSVFFTTYLTPETAVPFYLSPVFASGYAVVWLWQGSASLRSLYPLALWTVFAVGLLFAALWAYRRRNSEIAQQWGCQSHLSFMVKIFAAVLGACAVGLVFTLIGLDKTPAILMSAALGAPLGYIVAEVITGKGFGTIKKALPQIGASTLAVLCFSAYFAFGGFGFDTKVPPAGSVSSVEIEGLVDLYGFCRISDENARTFEPSRERYPSLQMENTFTSPELVEAVTKLHRATVQAQEPDAPAYANLELTYSLSSGRELRRGLSRVSLEAIAPLWQAPGYMEAANPFFELKTEYIRSAEVFNFLLESQGRLTEAQTAQLLEAIRKDLNAQTLKEALDTKSNREVGIFRFHLKDNKEIYEETGDLFHYTEAFFYLRPQCKNTMALMEQWGYGSWSLDGEPLQAIEALEILPEAVGTELSMAFPVREASRYYDKGLSSEYALLVEDPQLMREILSRSTHLQNSTQGGRNMVLIHYAPTFHQPEGETMAVYIDNEQLLSLCQAYGAQAPYVLTAQDCAALLQANGGKKFPIEQSRYDQDARRQLFQNAVSLGEYFKKHLPQQLAEKSPAAQEAMYRTAFLTQEGTLLYDENQIGEYVFVD